MEEGDKISHERIWDRMQRNSDNMLRFRKSWIQWALALSLLLHIGAALVIIYASGFSTGWKTPTSIILQDFELSPSISAPAKEITTPPAPAMTAPTQTPALEPTSPAQEQPHEQPASSPVSSEKVGGLMSTPLGLGMTHGYFSGLADGRTLRDDVRGYYFEVVEKINREWWNQAGTLKEPLRQDGIFELVVQRDGTIESMRILQGTGSGEADRLVTEIIKRASPLPPLPATYELDLFRAPLRIKAPSYLFRFRN